MDESLALMQRALGLLNSVSINPDMFEEAPKPAAKKSSGLFAKKEKAAEISDEMPEAPVERASPIASLKQQG